MLIEDPGTNYRLTSLQGHALEDMRCIVLDTQFVHRVSTWYYGPRKPDLRNASSPKSSGHLFG